jgi:HSP20 family molecular chaperone IbpA
MGLWGKDKDKSILDEIITTSSDEPTVRSRDGAELTPPIDENQDVVMPEIDSPDAFSDGSESSGGKMTKDYGIWNSAVVEVLKDLDLVRVTLDVPDEDKDKVVVETSIGKAAARLVDNVAGYLLEAARNVKVFNTASSDGVRSRAAVAGEKTIWDYASIRVDGDLVEVTVDVPGDEWDEVIVRTSRPKAAARLVDNVAGFLLGEAQKVKPFDGSEL